MQKKLLYIFVILAMLFGAFGMMAEGAVTPALAQEKLIGGAEDLESNAVLEILNGIAGIRGDLTGYGRIASDPVSCNAGDQTAWWRVQFNAPAGELAPRYATFAMQPEFPAVMVLMRSTGPNDGDHVVIGCEAVEANDFGMMTAQIVAGQEYKIMFAVRQGFPYAGEEFEFVATPHRNPDPVIVVNAVGALSNVTPSWATPEGLPFQAPQSLIRPGYTTTTPYTNLVDGGYSFFDFGDCAGPVNHMSWTDTVAGLNWVLFETVTRPAAVLLDPVATATVEVNVATDGGIRPYDLRLVPSAWQAEQTFPLLGQLGADVAGCQGVAAGVGGVCTFQAEAGNYDALLSNVYAPFPATNYILSRTNQALINDLIPEFLDFRAANLPQATINIDSADSGGIGAAINISASDALGATVSPLANNDRFVVNANAAKDITVWLQSANWNYALDPVFFGPTPAVTRTFTPGEEVTIILDSGSRNILGQPILPYFFDPTIEFNADLTEVAMTDFVDVVGNTLVGVAAPDDTLLPGDPNPACAFTWADEIVPHTLVSYGFGYDILVTEFTWDNINVTIPAPEIGRFYAQRALLTGPNVRAGDLVDINPYMFAGPGFVRGASAIGALSPVDVPIMTHWSWSWVMAMYEAGLTTGIEPGVFGPDMVMQRSEMAVFLSRLLQAYGVVPAGTAASFDDVADTYWAVEEIEHLRELAITDGCDPVANLYCPNQPVTRAEMAKFLQLTFRIIQLNNPGTFTHWDVNQNVFNPGTTFQDVPMEHWANIWIEELFFDGLTDGCRRDQFNLWFCPEESVTRGQMAKFIMSAHQPDAVTQAFWPVLSPER